MGELPLDADPRRNTVFFFGNETRATPSIMAHLAYRDWLGFAVFCIGVRALFLPYVALQRCKQSATTPSAGATYNYLNQAAPPPAVMATTAIHQEVQVVGVPADAAPAEPHQGGCNEFRILQQEGVVRNEDKT